MAGSTTATQRPLQRGLLVLGEYVLDQNLGADAWWVHYRARHAERPSERYAVRVLGEHPASNLALLELFAYHVERREALSHPGIAPLVASGVDGPLAVEVSRDDAGESLLECLARGGEPLTADEIARVVRETAAVLDYLHAQPTPIAHGALEPASIFLAAPHGAVRVHDVVDAHVLAAMGHAPGGAGHRAAPAYRAPELAAPGALATAASDQFALAAIAYECVVGMPAFSNAAVECSGSARPQVPGRPSVSAVLCRAWSTDPARRFASAGEFAEELARALAEQELPSAPSIEGPPPKPSGTYLKQQQLAAPPPAPAPPPPLEDDGPTRPFTARDMDPPWESPSVVASIATARRTAPPPLPPPALARDTTKPPPLPPRATATDLAPVPIRKAVVLPPLPPRAERTPPRAPAAPPPPPPPPPETPAAREAPRPPPRVETRAEPRTDVQTDARAESRPASAAAPASRAPATVTLPRAKSLTPAKRVAADAPRRLASTPAKRPAKRRRGWFARLARVVAWSGGLTAIAALAFYVAGRIPGRPARAHAAVVAHTAPARATMRRLVHAGVARWRAWRAASLRAQPTVPPARPVTPAAGATAPGATAADPPRETTAPPAAPPAPEAAARGATAGAQPDPSAAASLPEQPDARARSQARAAIAERIRACEAEAERPTGRHVRIAVTYAGATGSASDVRFIGEYFVGRPVGLCIAAGVREVGVGPFRAAQWQTDYSFMVH